MNRYWIQWKNVDNTKLESNEKKRESEGRRTVLNSYASTVCLRRITEGTGVITAAEEHTARRKKKNCSI